MFTFLLLVIVLLTLLYVWSLKWSGKILPPGIRGLQIVPYFAELARANMAQISNELLEKYGDITCIQMFNLRTIIIVGNHDLFKDAYSKPELADRPAVLIKHGLVTTNGHVWKEQRRFALSTLRDFGMGKIAQEERILQECDDLVKEFAKHDGKPFDPKHAIGCAVTNVICAVIFSHRYDYGDKTLTRFLQCICENLTSPRLFILNMVPFSRFLPGLRRAQQQLLANREFIASIVRHHIKEHEETITDGNVRDYIDAYLHAKDRESGDQDSTFTDIQLLRSVQDLFVAGSETTGTTLRWALALMALNPDVQRKVQEEIDDNIEKTRQPNMSDKSKLKYTDAVLLEVQRYATVVPVVIHNANTNTTLADYPIEKGYSVLTNFVRLNRDKRVWQYPNEFNVDNFYKDGEVINRNFFIAFSSGKRSCIGESLAKMETFLFFTSLMQKFNFSFNEGDDPDLTNPDSGIVRSPHFYKIMATSR